jgi:adenylate cyclase
MGYSEARSRDAQPLPRRLRAVLYADVAGYGRLTGIDEDDTHRRLSTHLNLIEGIVQAHEGRVVHYAGDAVLAEFHAIVDAVSCAVNIQRELSLENDKLPDERRVEFRIGVNLGDVITDRGEIYGDGVNAAVRLESLADPGGICISETVLTAMGNRLAHGYEYLGERKVKNMEEPMRAYRVSWQLPSTGQRELLPPQIDTSDRPSVVVLPFVNTGGDESMEYFSDGFTEDIITELSRFRELFVISRNTAFTYKGKSMRPTELGSAIGVGYVVEGSVRIAGEKIRINVQLIDAKTDHHVWAERFDREMSDLFEIQDQITRSVATTIVGRLILSAEDRAERTPTQNMKAWDYVLRAQHIVCDTAECNRRAQQHYEHAIALDPDCARAHCGLAVCHLIDWASHWSESPVASYERALECANRALDLDEADSKAHWVLAELLLLHGDYEGAREHLARALTLNPDDADAYAIRGLLLTYLGDTGAAIEDLATAIHLSAFHPAWYLWFTGFAHYVAGNYEAALAPLQEATRRHPKFVPPRLKLAATYARLQRTEEANEAVAEILRIKPDYRVALESDRPFRDPADLEHYLEGLRLAGMPE